MSRLATRCALGWVLLMGAWGAGSVSGSEPARTTAQVSAQTVPLGNTFELRASVAVPAGSTVYFPDQLPGTEAVESHGLVSWTAQASEEGATLSLIYPFIAFGIGDVSTPAFEVFIGAHDSSTSGAPVPGGSSIGAWSEAGHASRVLTTVAAQRVRIASIFQLEGVLAGVGPMPAADVLGASWNPLSLILMLASACVLLIVLGSATRKRWRRPPRVKSTLDISSREDPRRKALGELDSLLALGLHTSGRTREFYSMSSAIVRRHAERLDARWQRALTSTELMRDLQAHGESALVDALASEMSAAEVVKFGNRRPEAVAAEAHWRVLRDWIEKSAGPVRGD